MVLVNFLLFQFVAKVVYVCWRTPSSWDGLIGLLPALVLSRPLNFYMLGQYHRVTIKNGVCPHFLAFHHCFGQLELFVFGHQ